MYKVDNAVIMAAGTSSRFAPLSYEIPKALISVKGEVLIERQIRQLKEAGINVIYVVVGYKKEAFSYLKEKYDVILVENNDFLTRNNNASIYAVKPYLGNTYICSSDNYFQKNPFETEVDSAYYAGVYSNGPTAEWCMQEDEEGYICGVDIGGSDSWYMLGHTFWTEEFSRKFIEILDTVYDLPEYRNVLWESIYREHLNELKMKIRKYPDDVIFEFDTLDELRQFDKSYWKNTRSAILKSVAAQMACCEEDIVNVRAALGTGNAAAGFSFELGEQQFIYDYEAKTVRRFG